MLRKILKQIKLIFSSYPRRHLYLLLVGIIFLISITIFSSIKIDSNSPKEALFSQVSMEELDLDSAVEAETFNFIKLKRAEIKRNDSLFSILKRLGIEEKNIVTLVNSDRSNLLAQIKIGNTLEVGISDSNKVISLNYIKDFKSGVRAEKSGEVYEIGEYEQIGRAHV